MWVLIGQDMHPMKKTMQLFGIPVSKHAIEIPASWATKRRTQVGYVNKQKWLMLEQKLTFLTSSFSTRSGQKNIRRTDINVIPYYCCTTANL